MKRCFFAAVLCAVVILMTMTGCSKSSSGGGNLLTSAASVLTPSDPWTEFALMTAARSKATSWRSKMVSNQAGRAFEMDSEVMCPDKMHNKMTQGGQVTMESYIIGGTMYVNAGGRMMKVPNQMPATAFQCGGSAPSAASSSSPKFSIGSLPSMKDISSGLQEMEKMKQNVTITKGGVSMVEGSPCQEWNIVYNDPEKKQAYNSNYCVGVADHLPRRMTVDSGAQGKMEMTYWDWNSNISINPPTS
jgi:hypothetical protein